MDEAQIACTDIWLIKTFFGTEFAGNIYSNGLTNGFRQSRVHNKTTHGVTPLVTRTYVDNYVYNCYPPPNQDAKMKYISLEGCTMVAHYMSFVGVVNGHDIDRSSTS